MNLASDIHAWLQKKPDFNDLKDDDRLEIISFLYVKITGETNFQPKDIKSVFEEAQLSTPSNIHQCFSNLKRLKILLPRGKGYCFEISKYNQLEASLGGPHFKVQTISDLRKLLPQIASPEGKNYLQEAIDCFECGAYRATILMTWLLVVDHLQEHIMNKRLNDFNTALQEQKLKTKQVTNKSDFTDFKEEKFIEVCRSAGVITNNERKILDEKLGIRNSASHPNRISFGEAKTVAFVEDLIQNIYVHF